MVNDDGLDQPEEIHEDCSSWLDDMSLTDLSLALHSTFNEAAGVDVTLLDMIGTDVSGGEGKSTFVGSEIVEIDLSDFDASLLDILLQDDE